ELACPGGNVFFDHLGAGNVGRHQVGRELDAAEIQRQALGQTGNHERLGQARHTLKDAVSAAEQGDEQLLDHVVLADDQAGELLLQVVVSVAEFAAGGDVVARQRGGGSRNLGNVLITHFG